METKKCCSCGIEFTPKAKNQILCKPRCKPTAPKKEVVPRETKKPILEVVPRETEKPRWKAKSLTVKPMEKDRKFSINAFDIETDGFDGDLKMCGYAMETGESGIFQTGEEFALFLRDGVENNKEGHNRARWYAHNMGFDLTRLIKPLKDVFKHYELSIIESGLGNIISIILTHRANAKVRVQLVDSTAFSGKYPLEKLADSFGLKKTVGSIDFENGEKPDFANQKHKDYCINDCIILMQIMIKFDELVYEHFHIHIRITAASTALQAWIRTIPKGKHYERLTKEFEKFARLCYCGGFVTVGKDAYKIQRAIYPKYIPYTDAGSMYPYVMRKFGVPSGKPVKTTQYKKGDIGFYFGTVSNLTSDKINCVPFRTKHGLIFPHCKDGESFKTYLTSVDIENLLTDGSHFEVDYGYVFESLEYPFKQIVDTCENLRIKFKKTPVEMVAKLIQNSLYGKFGMKEEGREYIYTSIDEIPDGFIPNIIEANENTNESEYIRAFREDIRDEHYMLPHWAGWITSNARKHLHDFIRVAGFENLLYADTDSATFKSEALPKIINHPLFGKDEYGKFKIEHKCSEFRSLGAKVYGFKEGDQYGGACKGIAKKVIKGFKGDFFKRLIHDDKALSDELKVLEYQTIRSLNTVLSGASFTGVVHRSLSDINNSIKFSLNKNGEIIIAKIGNKDKYYTVP